MFTILYFCENSIFHPCTERVWSLANAYRWRYNHSKRAGTVPWRSIFVVNGGKIVISQLKFTNCTRYPWRFPRHRDALSSSEITTEMANKIARALNLLGADGDLLNSDADSLIDVIEDYFGDDGAGNDN